ncbi:arginine ABC transporter substrate-binding protein [Izhakiella australiensis]|uniref:Arginine ABC transporter substrate-binding protein n=1 Tax=Izhakiella australiensis TaxID=1926881 RepID=A0A1S8YQD0_9GAMM|nr:transporter substrate-binding domain-containing protein [Izhakiella australiensis]OON40986.1 arginine ABC transporter substrate-binding protein [Izhakiella australiensis]
MKTCLFALLLMLVTLPSSANQRIRFASSATYPPFEYLNADNQIIGFDIDLAKALCQQMKAHCTFVNNPFNTLLEGLKYHRYDAVISGLDITEERSKTVSFTSPYYENAAVVLASQGRFSSLQQMKGKRLGVETGTTHQTYFQQHYPDIIAVPYDSYINAMLDLQNQRLDGVVGDVAAASQWRKAHPDLAVVGQQLTDDKYFSGMAIAVRQDNNALRERFNTALAALEENGTLEALRKQWFPD